MRILARLALVSCLTLSIAPAALHAQEAADSKPPKEEKSGKKKKKKDKDKDKGKKDKDKDKAADEAAGVSAGATAAPATDAKGAVVESEAPPAPEVPENWCDWLRNDPFTFKPDKENPWFQSFHIGGRFHYQAAYLEGTDINGLDFNDKYDEYRRFRLETKTEFLKYFTAELNVNLVSDNRFRDDVFNELEWGYDRFDEASLEFDIRKAFSIGFLDGFKAKYGRMKLKMTEEQHMSSNEIYTIERSGIADKLGGEQSRPTGFTLELEKGDFDLVLGVFSAEDDSDFVGGWNDGEFFYSSFRWKPDKDFWMTLDYSQNNLNDENGGLVDDALGYGWAASLSATYDKKRWGFIAEAVYGDNGGANGLITRRAGDFHGFVIMPWVWIVEDKLQAVVQYQYVGSPESQGLQIPSRYIRAYHENGAVDVDNGRGNEHHYLYAGLNYHICKDRIKLMGGVALDDLTTRNGEVKGLTWQAAFRTAF